MNILRRLPLSRLLLLCALVVGIGVSATAIALALGAGQKPPAQAARPGGPRRPCGAAGGRPEREHHASPTTCWKARAWPANTARVSRPSPLDRRRSGRLWIAKDGRARLELEDEKGDTNIVWDGTAITIYDAAENTVYRYTPKNDRPQSGEGHGHGEAPPVAKIEEAIAQAAQARRRLRSDAGERRGPARLHRARLPAGRGQPDRRRRALLRRQHRRAAACRRLQLGAVRPGGRTRGRRRLLRPGLGLRVPALAAAGREGQDARTRRQAAPRGQVLLRGSARSHDARHGDHGRRGAAREGRRKDTSASGLEDLPKVKLPERRQRRASCAPRSAPC